MQFMLVRKDVKTGSTNVRFFEDRHVAIYEGQRLEGVFEGSDWWVAEVHYTAYAPRQGEAA